MCLKCTFSWSSLRRCSAFDSPQSHEWYSNRPASLKPLRTPHLNCVWAASLCVCQPRIFTGSLNDSCIPSQTVKCVPYLPLNQNGFKSFKSLFFWTKTRFDNKSINHTCSPGVHYPLRQSHSHSQITPLNTVQLLWGLSGDGLKLNLNWKLSDADGT